MTQYLPLDHFIFTRYRLTLEALGRIELPGFNQAIALQNEFGSIFRRMVCRSLNEDCLKCALYAHCPYAIVFYPKVPLEVKHYPFSRDIPYPFVIKPPLQNQNIYAAGHCFHFEFLIIGKAQGLLPYFLASFENIGRKGIGPQPGPFKVKNLELLREQGSWESVYSPQDHMVRLPDDQFVFSYKMANTIDNPERIRIRFLTPVSLKEYRNGSEDFFAPFLKQLHHQIEALSFFYCNHRLDPAPDMLERLMADVKVYKVDLHRVAEPMKPGSSPRPDHSSESFQGVIECSGTLEPFLPMLHLGALIHVGEANSFGQGWYALENPSLIKDEP
ncbi:MAG: CRISPR system precrRNA processing endoribonuclease RAMP protein Cas6 [Desulfobacteraceae bacterium]|nr:MAG: CRISPR system precrRNA processing endoribonuclease RAMP protein Cas6 [Desulfobacteraceae bacterium]